MEVYFNNEKYSDVIITLDDGKSESTFPAHRMISGFWSPFLDRLFQEGFIESQAIASMKPIVIEDVADVEIALELIEWMYLMDYGFMKIKLLQPQLVQLAKRFLVIPTGFDIYYPSPRSFFNRIEVDNNGLAMRPYNESLIHSMIVNKEESPLAYITGSMASRSLITITLRFYNLDALTRYNKYLTEKLEFMISDSDITTHSSTDSLILMQILVDNNRFSSDVKQQLSQFFSHKLHIE